MPIYEYECRGCGHGFEALVRGEAKVACPECASEEVAKVFSLPAVKSDGTRAKAMRAAKKRDKAQGRERMHEQLKYEQSHDRHG